MQQNIDALDASPSKDENKTNRYKELVRMNTKNDESNVKFIIES